MCGKSPNNLLSEKKFISLGQKELCPAAIPPGVLYLLLAFGILAVLLALSATYLRYKRGLRAWLRGHGISGLARCTVEDDTEKVFDVFVSFSSKDIDLVHVELLPRLEAMSLSYCTYEREIFMICGSRRRNFLASEWCRLEFRLAHQRALQDDINRLVIVRVDELEPGALDKDLRLYVRSANYLRWGEPNFWDRLVHSLAARETQRKLIVKRGPEAPAAQHQCPRRHRAYLISRHCLLKKEHG
ncbi:hypothetical protein MTO96_046955 [Rhipicephalus appendiculatus]